MTDFSKSSKDIAFEEAKLKFSKVKNSIHDLLYALGDDCNNLLYDKEDLDQEFIRSQYWQLAHQLENVYDRIEYLSNPVAEQGYIRHNESGRYELPSGTYFTSGSMCEILVNDEEYNEQYWVYTSIEHNGEDYYATAASLGKDVSINGMLVRVRKR